MVDRIGSAGKTDRINFTTSQDVETVGAAFTEGLGIPLGVDSVEPGHPYLAWSIPESIVIACGSAAGTSFMGQLRWQANDAGGTTGHYIVITWFEGDSRATATLEVGNRGVRSVLKSLGATIRVTPGRTDPT